MAHPAASTLAMPLQMSDLAVGDVLHILHPQKGCTISKVTHFVVIGASKQAALENGTLVNRMTLVNYHTASECPSRKRPKVNFSGSQTRQTWEVLSSSGKGTYQVSTWVSNGDCRRWSCSCTAGTYNRLCKHVKQKSKEVMGEEAANL